MNAAKHLAHLRLTCKHHDSSQMPACLEKSCWRHTSMQKNRWISVSFTTPQGAILCTMEMWRIPSLINVQTAPINIFISAYAPCWKHIQRDFKLYELISYLLRQLSTPTPPLPPPNIFSSSFLSCAHLLLSIFSISPHCRNGIWAFGVHTAGNQSWVSVPFESFSLEKVWANPLTAWRHTIW